jgi:lipoprotein-anchoring transpeptidase ErfK/SrfK
MNVRWGVCLVLLVAALALVCPAAAVAGLEMPGAPTITAPAQNALVGGYVVVSGSTSTYTAEVQVSSPSQLTTVAVATVSEPGTFTVTVAVPYGPSTISILARNDAGDSAVVQLNVWSLGDLPGYPAFVLVDKSDLYLYVVRYGTVAARYPIAIGMPRTPTKVGTFVLGRPMRGGGSWGALRMPLMKPKWVRRRVTVHVGRRHVRRWVRRLTYVKTTYYIHGTNDSASIGTWASLGCVRMYDGDVRAFAGMTGVEPCVIRE